MGSWSLVPHAWTPDESVMVAAVWWLGEFIFTVDQWWEPWENITWQRKTLLIHLFQLVPNPLAGFTCAHVRMSISMGVVEVSSKKIRAIGWWTPRRDRLCMRHCAHTGKMQRLALSPSSYSLCTTGLCLLCITRERKPVDARQWSPWSR